MITPSPWKSFLSQSLYTRTLDVVSTVAERIRDPQKTLAIAEIAAQQTSIPMSPNPVRLTFGPSGPALACAYLDQCFPNQLWDNVAHHYLDTSKLFESSLRLGLYGGTSGLGFILTILSRDGTRYQKARAQLNQHLCTQVTQQPRQSADVQGVMESEYDLISGVTGILAYLLTLHSEEAHVQAAVEHLLTYLIWLAGIDQETQRERWYIAPEHIMGEDRQQRYPDGYYNCGLAHGIPGPMAALALAWLEGYRVPGQRDALRSLSDWLLRYTFSDAWGINWADVVPLSATRFSDQWNHPHPTRAAWCYGAPGVARALWLTGLALEQPTLCQTAIQAIEAVLQRPIYYRNIDSPILCHGVAGLLAICLRFAHETNSTIIHAHIPLLVSQILDLYNPDFPLGFRDQERPQVFVDQTAWLNGVPGIVIALLAAALPVEPTWDRIMLLS